MNLLIKLVEQLLNDMKSGNSNISEKEQLELINIIERMLSQELSKTEAADYIGVCKATFDNYIKKGLIPEGTKRQGFKELSWKKSDLDKYLNKK